MILFKTFFQCIDIICFPILYCAIDFQKNSIDFAIYVAIFTESLPMDGKTNRRTDPMIHGLMVHRGHICPTIKHNHLPTAETHYNQPNRLHRGQNCPTIELNHPPTPQSPKNHPNRLHRGQNCLGIKHNHSPMTQTP